MGFKRFICYFVLNKFLTFKISTYFLTFVLISPHIILTVIKSCNCKQNLQSIDIQHSCSTLVASFIFRDFLLKQIMHKLWFSLHFLSNGKTTLIFRFGGGSLERQGMVKTGHHTIFIFDKHTIYIVLWYKGKNCVFDCIWWVRRVIVALTANNSCIDIFCVGI